MWSLRKCWCQRHQIIWTCRHSLQFLLGTWKPRVCARISTLFYTDCIELSFTAIAGTLICVGRMWMTVPFKKYTALRQKSSHHNRYFFYMFTISRSISQWQIKIFIQWTLTLVWIQALLVLCTFSIIFLAQILNNNFQFSA